MNEDMEAASLKAIKEFQKRIDNGEFDANTLIAIGEWIKSTYRECGYKTICRYIRETWPNLPTA